MDEPTPGSPTNLSCDDLQRKARYIRDVVAPTIASSPGEVLAPHLLANLRDIFAALRSTPMTVYALEYSRIEKALFEMCSKDTKWPDEFVIQAEKQLQVWTAQFGDIAALSPLLWVSGGRMHGIEKIQAAQRPKIQGKAGRILGIKDYGGQQTWHWSVNLSHSKDPRSFGHHGFEVGE